MTDFDTRWKELTRAAGRDGRDAVPPLSAERARLLAARGLSWRRRPFPAPSREWQSLAATAALLAGLTLVLWWSDAPLDRMVSSLADGVVALPSHVPPPPELPAAVELPSPAVLLAALHDLPLPVPSPSPVPHPPETTR
jgi:hypothetical protein